MTQHLLYSLSRLFAGAALSLAAGVAVGVLLGYVRVLRRVFSPIVYVLAPVPKIALLPLVMLWFGIGEVSKIFLIFLVMVFQIILAVTGATLRIPEAYFTPSRAAGKGHWFILRKIVLRGILPELFTAIRIGLATGVSVLFFAETYGTRRGLGFYIMDMWQRLEYGRMTAGIIALGLIGLALTLIIDGVERKMCKWRFL